MVTYRIVKNRSELLPPRIDSFAEAWQECDIMNAQAKNGNTYEVITDPADLAVIFDRLSIQVTGKPFTGKVIAVIPHAKR